MSQESEGRIAIVLIFAIIGLIQFIVFLLIEIYFLLFLPIIFLIIGATIIGISLNENKESAILQPDLSPSNTETDDGPIFT